MGKKAIKVNEIIEELITVGDYIRWVASVFNDSDLFYGHGTDNPWDEAAALVYAAINLPATLAQPIDACRLTSKERRQVAELAKKRMETKKPLAYLTERAYFCGVEFYVNENVLVPRSPIAELIEAEYQPWLLETPGRVLDLCTGSGCIGLATAMAFPEASVDCSDISDDALAVAATNIERLSLEHRVKLIRSDVFSNISEQQYDLIVSNPPYVDAVDMDNLPEEFRAEPALGLAAGVDGLAIVDMILAEASQYLSDQGILICEVGNSEYALIKKYPNLPFVWLEFAHGGSGVFMLTGQDLKQNPVKISSDSV